MSIKVTFEPDEDALRRHRDGEQKMKYVYFRCPGYQREEHYCDMNDFQKAPSEKVVGMPYTELCRACRIEELRAMPLAENQIDSEVPRV
jgi:hypothetical protein